MTTLLYILAILFYLFVGVFLRLVALGGRRRRSGVKTPFFTGGTASAVVLWPVHMVLITLIALVIYVSTRAMTEEEKDHFEAVVMQGVTGPDWASETLKEAYRPYLERIEKKKQQQAELERRLKELEEKENE